MLNLHKNVFLAYQRQGGDNGDNNLIGTNQAHDLMIGFAGQDMINGMSNDDELYGGPDSDTFIFNQNSGFDVIGDFLPYLADQINHDIIDLSDYQTNFADLNFSSDGFSSIIEIDYMNRITILGLEDHTNLTAHDFIF